MLSTDTIYDLPVRASGIVTFANYDILDAGAERFLAEAHDISRKDFFEALGHLGPAVRQRTYKNMIQNTGLDVLAGILAGITTYTGAINYGCLGTGSAAVGASDGQLETEVFRKLYASRENASRQTLLDFYFSKSDTNGTYQEFGVCIDGSGSANSGQFYNRVLTGGWVKSSSVGMTVSIQFNLTAA